MVPERITTERLILRRFTRRDVEAVAEAVGSSLPELQRWLPWAHPGYSHEETAAFVRDSIQSWKEGRAYDYAIRDRARPGVHLGNISIWQVSKLGRTGEIGYWVRTDRTSNGIATDATRSVLQVGFDVLGFHKATLRIAVGNRPSERVAEKLGFVKEGVLREELLIQGRWVDHSLYSLLEHEYRRLQATAATPT